MVASNHLTAATKIKAARFLLPALLGISSPNDSLQDLLALPPQWGGMGIFNPSEQCSKEYDASLNITEPLANCISTASSGHSCRYFHEIRAEQFLRKRIFDRLKFLCVLQPSCPAESQSSAFFGPCHCQRWLSALPLSEYGFTPHKSAFHDAVALRYDWLLG